MKKKIIFICEADIEIGFGHLNRINNLAKSFFSKGYQCYLFGVKKKYVSNNYYKEIYSKNLFDEDEVNLYYLRKKIVSNNFFLVIDNFNINVKIQKILKKNKIKWLQFDNLNKKNKKIYADIIVNANPIVKKKEYSKILFDKKKQTLLLGMKYMIIRDEFKLKHESQRKKILICSGGGVKDNGFLIFVTSFLLRNFKHLKLIIILKKNDLREKVIIKLNKGTNNIQIIRDTSVISKYFSQSKIAIISGGTILLESLFFRIHRIIFSTAENQKKNSQAWNKLSYASYLGNVNQKKKELEFKFKEKITYFLAVNNAKKLKKNLINGKERIVKKILTIL
mgnify:CR=1 FL=1